MASNELNIQQYKKMTETPIPKLILGLAAPTILSMLITSIYNLADTFFVGRISTSASGAVGVVALNFIVGGLIGGVILIWRLAVAAWYIPLTIYRLLNVGRVGVAEIGEE